MFKTKENLFDFVELRTGKRQVNDLSDLQKLFTKVYTNQFYAYVPGTNEPQHYRRDDLDQWAKEARERGASVFYAEPVDPSQPCGRLRLCEPQVQYVLKRKLNEAEFVAVFGNNNTALKCYED